MGKMRRKTYRRKNTLRKNTFKKRQNRKHRYVKKSRLRKARTNRKTRKLKRYKKQMKGGRTQECRGRDQILSGDRRIPQVVLDCENVYDDGEGLCNTSFGCPTAGPGWYKKVRFGRNKPLEDVLLEGQRTGTRWYKHLMALSKNSQLLEKNDLICPVCSLILYNEKSMYYIGHQKAPQLTLEPLGEYFDPVNSPSDRKDRHVDVGVAGKTPLVIREF